MDIELKKLTNEVHRKLGRNICIFQGMEGMLKFLHSNTQKVSGYASEIQLKKEKQLTSIRKQTMGQLIKPLIENTTSCSEKNTGELEESKEEFWFYISGSIPSYDEEEKNTLTLIVKKRNELVHHFVSKWDLNSIKDLKEAELYLEQQKEKILPEYYHLQKVAKRLQEAKKIFVDFLNSDEGE